MLTRQAEIGSSMPITIVGHPFAPIGMGEHARSVYRAMKAVQMDAKLVDIYGRNDKSDPNFAEYVGAECNRVGKGANIYCINGDEVEQALGVLRKRGSMRGYNIVYPAWELERYPEEWAKQLDRFDEVWAPSQFIANSIEKVVSKPVVHMTLACEVPGHANVSRKRFGIPDGAFAFLFFFDFLSYIERKNPFAVLDAFEQAFSSTFDDAALVVKVNNSQRNPAMMAELKDYAARLKRQVFIVDATLTDAEMKALVWLCDAFVSLHRSEGFGRGMSEAMSFGKPVIATGYSGNLDFCTPDNSLLVDYDMIDLLPDEYPHWENQRWADPDVNQAAGYMRRLVDDQSFARELGESGMATIYLQHSYRACGVRYVERFNAIAAQSGE